ncbi:Premnaspirodiene oxygenase [Linum grandiflorum]
MTMMNWRGLETHRALRELAQKYGPVMRLQLGELSHVVISSAEAAKQVLKTHDVNFASRPFHLASSIISYNLQNIAFSPYGEYRRQMRKICIVELLSAKRVASFCSIREDEESKMVEQLAKSVEPEGVNMRKLFVTTASNVTSKAAFGMVREVNEAFMEVIEKIVDAHAGFRLSDIYPSVKLLPVINGFRSKLVSLHRAVDAMLEDIINQHRDARKQTSTSTSQEKTEDIVDILLNLQETGACFLVDLSCLYTTKKQAPVS